MIVAQEKQELFTNAKNESNFRIMASGHVFALLSEKIYAHKVPAVVRELVCNAVDSHVASGQTRPIKVRLPNSIHPYFEVEDFGLGMSDDDVTNIYTVYGMSTKTNSNDVIGALGIGAKSPFAYTKTFSILTRKDSVERLYNAYIGSDGEPKINLVAKKATDEQNGVKVSIPVKECDFQSFKDESSFILSFFNPLPEVVGDQHFEFANTEVAEALESDGMYIGKLEIQQSSLYNSSIYAVMGGVCYCLTSNEAFGVSYDKYDLVRRITNNSTLFVKFAMGELSFSASRERLSFEEGSTEKINSRFAEVFDHIISSKAEEIENAPNKFIAHALFKDYFQEIQGLRLKYKKKSVYSLASSPVFGGVSYIRMTYGWYDRGYQYGPTACQIGKFYGIHTVKVVYDTKKRPRSRYMTKNAASLYKSSDQSVVVVLVVSKTMTDTMKSRIERLLPDKVVQFIDVQDYIDNEYEPVERKQKLADTVVYGTSWFMGKSVTYGEKCPCDKIDLSEQNTLFLQSSDVNSYFSFRDEVKLLRLVGKETRHVRVVQRNTRTLGKMDALGIQSTKDFMKDFLEKYEDEYLILIENSYYTISDDHFSKRHIPKIFASADFVSLLTPLCRDAGFINDLGIVASYDTAMYDRLRALKGCIGHFSDNYPLISFNGRRGLDDYTPTEKLKSYKEYVDAITLYRSNIV